MKVSVLGAAGCIGMSAAFEIATSRLADELVLLDVRENLAQHHAMDLRTVASALDVSVKAGRYEDAGGSDVVIHAAGVHGDLTADRTAMLVENIRTTAEIARQLREHCPRAVVITVVNPVDALNWALWRAGGFERRQIVGYSFNDTLRFRELAAQAKAVEGSRVQGLTIGEHGFTQVPLFSSVRVDGQPVAFSEDEKQRMRGAHRAFFEKLEGLRAGRTTGWTTAVGLATLTRAIVGDTREIIAGSAVLDGEYGLRGLSIGVPLRLGRAGIDEVVEWELSPDERAALERSAQALSKNVKLVEETLKLPGDRRRSA